MSESFRLDTLRIRGFRGFPEQAGWHHLSLVSPCTVIHGIQGGGKSSALHAIAWCLFGKAVANKTATGIQERKNWLVQNQRSQDAWVQLTLTRGQEQLRIERCTSKRGETPAFFFTSSRTGTSTDETELHHLLGIDLGDYMSCVHLHQEMVSSLMLQDPADRKASFERLLGLADLQNFYEGLKKTRLTSMRKELEQHWQLLTQKLQTHLAVRTTDLEQARREARRFGLSHIDREDISQRCKSLLESLRALGSLPEALDKKLQPRFLDADRGFSRFLDTAKSVLRWFQESQPLVEQERDLHNTKEQWLLIQQKLAVMEPFVTNLASELQEFHKTHGTREMLQPAFAMQDTPSSSPPTTQEDPSDTSIPEQSPWKQLTLQYLESHSSPPLESCPLCDHQPFDAHTQIMRLRTQLSQVSQSQGQATSLTEMTPTTSMASKVIWEQLVALEDRWARTCHRVFVVLQECIKMMQPLLEKLSASSHTQALHSLMAEFSKNSIKTQPLQVLASYREHVAAILAQFPVWIEDMQQQATQAHTKFRAWEEELERLRQAQVVLDLVEEVEDLQQLEHSEEIEQAQVQLQHVYAYIAQITQLQETTKQVLQDMAEKKLGMAREHVRQIYRKLSDRVDYPEITIDVEKFEVMAADGDQQEAALRFFNKGDINCAALSIFLALSSASLLAHRLGFILLDDPSQHMDLNHKQKLAHVLAEIQQGRQLVIATAEPDFLSVLQENIPQLQVHTILDWNPQQGPLWERSTQTHAPHPR